MVDLVIIGGGPAGLHVKNKNSSKIKKNLYFFKNLKQIIFIRYIIHAVTDTHHSGGSTVKVKKLTGEGPVKRRIMDMGITKGVDIYVRKVAPLGDPIEVTVRGYELSLRKADAEMIEVE